LAAVIAEWLACDRLRVARMSRRARLFRAAHHALSGDCVVTTVSTTEDELLRRAERWTVPRERAAAGELD